MVAQDTVPMLEKVVPIYPPDWLNKIVGKDVSRLLYFFWWGIKIRPDFVGGFHLLLNGLSALLLSQIIGARSIYICGGGPREVLGGGYSTENRIFGKLKRPDLLIEKIFIKVISNFDLIIVRGKRAATFFKDRNVNSNCYIVPGGIDSRSFRPRENSKTIDLIFVGRLSSVKRVDILLRVIKKIKNYGRNIKAVIVGGGPLLESLKRLSIELNIQDNVEFVGHQDDVSKWLKKSKIFILTSQSEGRSLAMMEAMLSAIPVVVPKVGDLDEMVDDGENGYLISNITPCEFAKKIFILLSDADKLKKFGRSALRKAKQCDVQSVSNLWDQIFMDLSVVV